MEHVRTKNKVKTITISKESLIRDSHPSGDITFKYDVILAHVESKSIRKRRIGYALCIPKFNQFPETIQHIVRSKWLTDVEKEQYDYQFEKLCNKIFLKQKF